MKASDIMRKKKKTDGKKDMGDALMAWIGSKNHGSKAMVKAGDKNRGKK